MSQGTPADSDLGAPPAVLAVAYYTTTQLFWRLLCLKLSQTKALDLKSGLIFGPKVVEKRFVNNKYYTIKVFFEKQYSADCRS